MSARAPRSKAEWASLTASLAVVIAVVVLILTQVPNQDSSPAPVAAVEDVRRVGELFHVDVSVRNRGDGTAASVQVAAELTIGDQVLEGDQTIDFLSGDEGEDVTFVFAEDPADGELRVAVTGYSSP